MEESILSAKGRIRRTTFWTRWLIIFAIYLVLAILQKSTSEKETIILTGIGSLVLVIFMIIQGIKRMHDVNKSGWFIIIPIYNIVLAFTDGTSGINDYGEDPKGRNKICKSCQSQNDTNAQTCVNCGETLYRFAQTEGNFLTSDSLILIYIIYCFCTDFIRFLIRKFVPNWYEGFGLYIQISMNFLTIFSFIILIFAIKNKKSKILGIVLTSIWAIYIICINIEWLLRYMKIKLIN